MDLLGAEGDLQKLEKIRRTARTNTNVPSSYLLAGAMADDFPCLPPSGAFWGLSVTV